MRRFIAALTTSALLPLTALAADAQTVRPECYCTDRSGSRVELGEIICLQVDGRAFLARCEMSLNNPMWRELDEGCLSSGASPGPLEILESLKQGFAAHGVYPHI